MDNTLLAVRKHALQEKEEKSLLQLSYVARIKIIVDVAAQTRTYLI